MVRFIVVFALTLAVWLLLSGKYDAFHVGWGVLGAWAIAFLDGKEARQPSFPFARFGAYLPWQMYQIVVSNVRVARLVLSPRMPIEPRLLRRDPGLTDPRALTLLGCSITLTPGTLTVEIDEEHMLIHALDSGFAEDIEQETMARKIQGMFGARDGGEA